MENILGQTNANETILGEQGVSVSALRTGLQGTGFLVQNEDGQIVLQQSGSVNPPIDVQPGLDYDVLKSFGN